jgi:hypothetical protein
MAKRGKKTHGKCIKKGRGKGGKKVCRKFAKKR